jgi:hypothetical protein
MMAQFSETDVREMLECRAAEFAMASVPPDGLHRKARRRQVRTVATASATALALIALAGLSVNLVRGGDRRPGPEVGGDSAAGAASRTPASDSLRLVDYSVRAPARANEHAHSRKGPVVTLEEARRHIRCMRSHGFDLPEPAEQPGGGWAVVVDRPRARGLDFRSRAFRTAEFVTCGPVGGPLSGEMVIGGRRPKIDRFIACMRRQGYNLPEPTRDTSGSYDIDEWQFDLTRTGIDTSTQAWNRAMFVTCGPED